MPRRPSDQDESPAGDANVLPVMNIMFLLIPALLLAMETASMAGVAISPPKLCGGCSDSSEPTNKEPLELSVTILAEGFRVTHAGQQQGAEVGRAQDSHAPTLPLAKPAALLTDYDRYDYAALEQLAREYKQKHPSETVVRVSAENDIPAQVLINTLDALRGSDCKLGHDPSESECLFFRPVVEAGQ